MSNILSHTEFQKISKYISDKLGLNFRQDRQADLERGLKAASAELGYSDVKKFVELLLGSLPQKEHINRLAIHLTIGETYFMREPRSFEILKEKILPELIKNKNHLRIWSAGCCTGEEPYSIAIVLDEMLPEEIRKNTIILGTDINTGFLEKATEGLYSEWSFRNVPEHIRKKYFLKLDSRRYQISDSIKKMVRFAYLNLMEDTFPSLLNETNAMDIIFCRNVLLYFSADGVKRVMKGFCHSLVDKGWLVPGMTELSHLSNSSLQTVHFPDAIFFRKISSATGNKKEERPAAASPISGEALSSTTTHLSISERMVQRETEAYKKKKSTQPKEKIKSKPREEESYSFNTALKLFEAGDYETSARQFEYLIKNSRLARSETDEAYMLLSKAYANTGKIGDALFWCEKAIELDKLNPVLYLLLCNLLQEENRTPESIEAVKKAIYLNPDYIMAHFTLGNIYRRTGSRTEAERYLSNALELLNKMGENERVEGAEGITAGRLRDIISVFLSGKGKE